MVINLTLGSYWDHSGITLIFKSYIVPCGIRGSIRSGMHLSSD
jgi:hypothetical protein